MNIGIIGYGKMGKSIEKVALERGHHISAIIDQKNLNDIETLGPDQVDVAIEFSKPDAAFQNIYQLIKNGVSVISGTTGWLDRYKEIEEHCNEHNGAFLCASNFSLGVNIFFQMNEWLATIMQRYQQFNVTVDEVHHTEKLDKPSGTAITLAQGIINNNSNFDDWISDQKGAAQQLSIWSKREKDVPGTHTITYESPTDQIEIKHLAKSREGFALGAVLVAEWILDRKGVFTMNDFLKI